MATIAKMADVAGHIATNDDHLGFNFFARGFAEYRMGHFASAADLLQKVIPLDVGTHCRTEAYLVLAMTQFQLQQPEASRASLAAAMDAVNHQLPKAGHLSDEWSDWIIIHVLLREAGTLMRAAVTPETPAWQTALANAGLKFTSDQEELVLDGGP